MNANEMKNKITFKKSFFALLFFVILLLGMDLLLLIQAILNNEEFSAFILGGISFGFIILVVIRVNLRRNIAPSDIQN